MVNSTICSVKEVTRSFERQTTLRGSKLADESGRPNLQVQAVMSRALAEGPFELTLG